MYKPKPTLTNEQTIFARSLNKQGFAYAIAKDFVLSATFPKNIKSSFWPAVGDLTVVQTSPSEFSVQRMTPESSIPVASAANSADAIKTARSLVSANTISISQATKDGYKLIYQSRNRYNNIPISADNFSKTLASAFFHSAYTLNKQALRYGDVIISAVGPTRFEVGVLDHHLTEKIHSAHEAYPNALSQAEAIVGDAAIWLKSDAGIKLVSARSGRYADENLDKGRKEVPGSFYAHLRDKVYNTTNSTFTIEDAKKALINELLKNGWSTTDALKEAKRWCDFQEKAHEVKIQVDTGMYGWDPAVIKNLHLDNEIVSPGVDQLADYTDKENQETGKVKSSAQNVEVFYLKSDTHTKGDSIFSMESVSLPELSDSPMILMIMPSVAVPSLFKECEENQDDAECIKAPQFLSGDAKCDSCIFLASSKNIPADAEILSKKVRFNPVCSSKFSQILKSAASFKEVQ